MSAAPNLVTNSRNQPFLAGEMAPVTDELDVASCRTTGEVPGDLLGKFIQNGPNPRFEPLGRYHMFDGDGMLHAIEFAEGRVSYRNRWIRTPMLAAEMRAGRALYPGLADLMNFPDASLVGDAGPIKNPANTNIIRHAGKYLARTRPACRSRSLQTSRRSASATSTASCRAASRRTRGSTR